MEWNQLYITNLITWRKNRIRNYAEKKGITFTEAIYYLQCSHFSNAKVTSILDAVVDPEFQSANQPKKPI